jgi:putative ABC transport system permease protein
LRLVTRTRALGLAGVFNTVMLSTREKARDIGILKVYGMTPAQTVAMVLCSVAVLGAVAGVLGLPLGEFLLVLIGLAVALLGALVPARWAAASRVAAVLHAE